MHTPVSVAAPRGASTPGSPQSAGAPGLAGSLSLRHLELFYDAGAGALWSYLRPDAPVCFTPGLLAELGQTRALLAGGQALPVPNYRAEDLRYHVMLSRIPGVYSLGGDLGHFLELIRAGERERLHAYAVDALELVCSMASGHGRAVTTLALVRGQAMGGGFEAAIAADVVVAERGATFAFPEILFNLFPGMGAYGLLRRRLSHVEAERLILGGRSYGAEELHGLGVVDLLAEPGEGERVVRDYMKRNQSRQRGRAAWRRALEVVRPLPRAEMHAMLEVWVDTAMALQPRDLEVMEFVRRNQARFELPVDALLAG